MGAVNVGSVRPPSAAKFFGPVSFWGNVAASASVLNTRNIELWGPGSPLGTSTDDPLSRVQDLTSVTSTTPPRLISLEGSLQDWPTCGESAWAEGIPSMTAPSTASTAINNAVSLVIVENCWRVIVRLPRRACVVPKGDPDYQPKLDRDNDGIVCEG
jgi:hypothetical protein